MGYLIGTIQTYCGFTGTYRIPCRSCKTDNTWQKLSLLNYRCTRCNANMSFHESLISKIKFADSQLELKELEEQK